MTVTASTREHRYQTDGIAGAYSYSFRILFSTDLVVVYQETTTPTFLLLEEGVDYTVSQVGNDDGGNVVLISPAGLPNGGVGYLWIYARESDDQLVDVTQGSRITRVGAQEAFDKRCRVSQERVPRFPMVEAFLATATDTSSGWIPVDVVVPCSAVQLSLAYSVISDVPGTAEVRVDVRPRGFPEPSAGRLATFNATLTTQTVNDIQSVFVGVDSGEFEYRMDTFANASTSAVAIYLSSFVD